jgi:Tol biopolymer transport system component
MDKLRLFFRLLILAVLIALNPITLFAQSRQFDIVVGDTIYYFGYSKDLTSEQRHNHQEEEHYYLKDIRKGNSQRMFNDEIEESMGRGHYFFISPDRQLIGIVTSRRGSYGESENRLFIYDISSGSIKLLIDEHTLIVYPIFSPDSKSIAYYSSDPRVINWQWDTKERHKGCALKKVDVASKEIVELAPENYWLFRFTPPSWSPDGKRILFQAKFEEKGTDLYCLDIKNKKQIKIVPGDGLFSVDAMAWMSNDKILFSSGGAISERKPGIYQMNPDGTEVKFLISTATVTNKIMEDLDKKHILFDDTDKIDRLLKARSLDLNGNDLTDLMMKNEKIIDGHYWKY